MMSDNEPSPISSEAPRPAVRAGRQNLALLLALAALFASGWQWHQSALHQEDADSARQQAATAQHALAEQLAAVQTRLLAVEGRFAEVAAQNDALQNLAQEIGRGREETILIEVEQAVTLAAQQLQLAGNVRVALLALQAADARLARLDRPQYLPLRRALTKDIERLNALPLVDVPGISLRVEQLVLGVDKLPLASDGRPAGQAESMPASVAQAWWQRAGNALWLELKGLVRIQRFDSDDALLLAPGQSFLLRENIKLRLLSAKLALLARDQATFRSELKMVLAGLGRYFVADDKMVLAALASLRQMMPAELNGEWPTLSESQAALRSLRNGKEKR